MTLYLFMVKKPDGMLAFTRGGSITKKLARDKFTKSIGRNFTWREAYKRGCRVVTVKITEVAR